MSDRNNKANKLAKIQHSELPNSMRTMMVIRRKKEMGGMRRHVFLVEGWNSNGSCGKYFIHIEV